ncbi:MAG: hypothetical protein RBU45_13830 [Myxococcota bacterium]|nr:hypothetical protein [Myxococcota bacterium]
MPRIPSHIGKMALVLALGTGALLTAGCGAQAGTHKIAEGGSRARQAEAEAAHAELLQVERRLVMLPDGPASTPSPPPPCPEARVLVERICLLADRICRLATEHPADQELAELCAADRPRCRAAEELLARRCPTPP